MTTIKFEATARFDDIKIGSEIFTIQGDDSSDFGKAIREVGQETTEGEE